MNPYQVNPLGGLDLGAAVGDFGQKLEQSRMREQQQESMQLQQQKQENIKNLALKSMEGDLMASKQLWAEAPEYAAQIDKSLGIQDEAQSKQVGGWLEQYLSTPSESRQEFLEKTASSTPFTVDDDLLAMDAAQRDQYANLLAGRYLNEDQLSMLVGNSSDTTSQKDFKYYQDLQQRDPEAAEKYGMAKGYVETGRDAAPTTEQRNWKEYQKLKKSNPEEARQYGQAAGFVSKEGRELSVAMQKRLSEATDESVKAGANVIRYKDLASQIDGADMQGGWGGRAEEVLKSVTGQQDFKTELRKDFYAIRGAEVVNNLPQGAASDIDVNMAMQGFPDDNSTGEQIASFLRGLSKLNKYKQEYNRFKADYISENGSERNMLKEWGNKSVAIETPQRTIGKYKVSEVK